MGKKKIIPLAETLAEVLINVWLCGKKFRVNGKQLDVINGCKSDKEAIERLNLK